MSKWLNYEKMIARIYETISPRATVRHNDSIIGRDSRSKRQIDVSIRFTEIGCDFLVIVQAKDYKYPADVNVVGEFAAVIKDVVASKGVLVCNAGFTESARTLAKNLGIDLCSAYDAESKDWHTTLTIPVVWEKHAPHLNFGMQVYLDKGDSIPRDVRKWVLSTDMGKTKLDLVGTFVDRWNAGTIPKDINKVHHLIPQSPNIHALVNKNKWAKVDKFTCSYMIERKLYRKEVITEEFTGLKNYLTGDIEISKLTIKMPKLKPEEGWKEIDDSLFNLISKERLIVTVSEPEIDQSGFMNEGFVVRQIG